MIMFTSDVAAVMLGKWCSKIIEEFRTAYN